MSSKQQRIVIIGATSLIAEHCARLWVTQASSDMILVGRDTARMEQIATDLKVRSPDSQIKCMQTDFIAADKIAELVASITNEGAVDIALIAHGSLPDQQLCQQDLTLCQDTLLINGLSPVLFAEAFATSMQKANRGTLAIIGSVAGDRGRKSNYIYGSAKGLVSRYVQGMQHRFANTRVKIVLIKPGPTDTPMTTHLKQQGAKLASAEEVALDIVNGISKGALTIYAPPIWKLIMMIVRHLPAFLFNRLNI